MAEETKVIRIIVDASKAVDGSAAATRALERMEKQQAATTSAIERMEGALGRMGFWLKGQLVVMATDLASRLVLMAKNAFNAASGLEELAEQLGITATGLQGLQFAAVQNGAKLEQLETGVNKFSQKMGEAAGGSKEMIEALDKLGVKILDANGKLRPTQELMTEVAYRISNLSDPAAKAAAAVDFFGKTGAKLLPTMKDMGQGFDAMAERARRAGAMIEKDAAEKLAKLADWGERANLTMRALFANNAAGPLTSAIEYINGRVQNLAALLLDAKNNLTSLLALAANPGAYLARAFTNTPTEDVTAKIAERQKLLRESDARLAGLGTSRGDERLRAREMDIRGRINRELSDLNWRQMQQQAAEDKRLGYNPADPDGVGVIVAPRAGATQATVKGAGQSEANRIAKLLRDSRRDLDAANAFAEASTKGAAAVSDLEIKFKALKAAQDAFGDTADKNTGQVNALAKKIEELLSAADRAKALKDFNLGTEELQRSNELLAAENALINASVEDRAREIALIKLKHDVQSKGLDETNEKEREAIERRREAITTNERLKAQAEEMRKANELWTAPLKRALESIQTTAADMWERILENGKFSMEEFGQLFIRTARRAAAELLALATIRPVIGMAVQGLGSLGLVSPQTASALGYGGGGMGGLGGGGFGGMSMPGGFGTGGLSSSLGSFGQWLNTPFTGPYAGMSPASMQGVPMLSPSLMSPSTWSITPLQGLGAIAGIGSGIFQLATGNGSTGSTIGGIGSMIGGAVSLIPGVGQIAGPLIALGSSLLGGLFGDSGPKIPPQPPLQYGAGVISPAGAGYTYSGNSLNGAAGMSGAATSIGGTVQSLFARAGLSAVPGYLIGGDIASGVNTHWNGQGWQGTPYTQIGLHTPTGYERITYNDSSRTAEQAAEYLIAEMFKANVLRGGVSGGSANLPTAIAHGNPMTAQGIGEIIDFVKVYDNIGKSANAAKEALLGLDNQFGELSGRAYQLGLSLAPVEEQLGKERKRWAEDFIDGMLDPLAVHLRALEDQQKASIASAEYIRDYQKDVYVDMARITEYWNNKRLDLEAQYQEQSVGQLQALIRRLTYGDLANASPDTSLAGTRGTYEATLAQARAGSGAARANLAGYAEAYASSARSYFASSAEYDAIVASIRSALLEVVGGTGTAAGGAANGNNPLLQTVAEQSGMVAALVAELREVKDQLAAATAQMQRRG